MFFFKLRYISTNLAKHALPTKIPRDKEMMPMLR